MKEKYQNVIVRVAVVLYCAACCVLIAGSACKSCGGCSRSCSDCTDSCCATDQTPEMPMNITQLGEALSNNLLAVTGASLNWLDNQSDPENPLNYPVTKSVPLTPEQLSMILVPDFYNEKPQVQVMGMFLPIMRVDITVDGGREYKLLYSFLNGQVDMVLDGETIASAMLVDKAALDEAINSID